MLTDTEPADGDPVAEGRPRTGSGSWLVRAASTWAVVMWLLVLRLWWAFLRTDLTFVYVAEHTWLGERWWYRAVGVWGGMDGSLLLFAAMLAGAVAVAVRRPTRQADGWFAFGASVAIGVGSLVMAWPFERLDVPAVQGFGIEPILRHPAMVIHPPLLYVGLVLTVGAFVRPGAARGWLLGSAGALTAAMALGGWWSYAEQGWGGYWGWDPVENTSLVVWLGVLVAIHASSASRWQAQLACRLCFLVTVASAALARSGSAVSVHSFAESAEIGLGLAVVAVVVGLGVVLATIADRRARDDRRRRWSTDTLTAVLLLLVAEVALAVMTAAPVLAGGNGARLAGTYYARALGAVALVVVVALVVLLVRARRHPPVTAWIAHAGVVLVLIGAFGSSFDRAEQRWLVLDEPTTMAGVEVRLTSLDIGSGPTPLSSTVTATIDIDGDRVRPALVTFPERGGTLPETARIGSPVRDVQVVLESARDGGRALVTVRVKPLVSLVWVGATTVLAGTILGLIRRRRPRRHQSRLRRPRLPRRVDGLASEPGVR